MAIQKQLTLTDGTQGNYWRVDAVIDNVLLSKCSVTLNLYKTAAKADEAKGAASPGSLVMATATISLEGSDYPLSDSNLSAAGKTPGGEIYKKIKAKSNDVLGADLTTGQDV